MKNHLNKIWLFIIILITVLPATLFSQQPTNSLKITNQKPGITKEVEITPNGNLITNLDVEAIPEQLETGELKIEKIDAGVPEAKVVISEDKFMVPDRCISETNISDPFPGDIELNNVKNQLSVPQVIFPGEEAGSNCLVIAGSVEERENPVEAVMYMDNLVYELEDDVYQLAYANLGSEGKSIYENDNTFFQYHLKDHLGSTRMVLAEDLSLKESMAYHPYGQEVPIDVDNSGEKLRDKFTGKELDDEGTAGVIHLDITVTGFTSTTGSEGELVITYVDGGEQEVIELQNLDLSGTVVQYQQIVSLLSEKVIDQLELNVTGSEPDIISYIFDFDNSDEDYSEVIEMGDKVTLGLTETVQDINGGGSGGFMIYNQDDAYVGLDLNYFGARFYCAEIGLWISTDPLREFWNTYAYGLGNPLNGIDPNGLKWIWEQSTGTISHLEERSYNQNFGQETVVATGYAGAGAGLNNSNMQSVQFVGPLPQGDYTIGSMQNYTTNTGTVLQNAMVLTENPNNQMYNRTGFLIHGDDGSGNQTGSAGCPILPPAIRTQIDQSGDNSLEVIHGPTLGPVNNDNNNNNIINLDFGIDDP